MIKNKHIKSKHSDEQILSSPMIEISHFEEDKHIKTETFPLMHFMDSNTRDLKQIRYN